MNILDISKTIKIFNIMNYSIFISVFLLIGMIVNVSISWNIYNKYTKYNNKYSESLDKTKKGLVISGWVFFGIGVIAIISSNLSRSLGIGMTLLGLSMMSLGYTLSVENAKTQAIVWTVLLVLLLLGILWSVIWLYVSQIRSLTPKRSTPKRSSTPQKSSTPKRTPTPKRSSTPKKMMIFGKYKKPKNINRTTLPRFEK